MTAPDQGSADGAPAFPYRYGRDDRIGAANEITPEKVIRATSLVKEGRRYQLGQILEDGTPQQMTRYWKHSLGLDRVIPGRYLGHNHQSFVEETVSGALHSGTHIDSLGHIGIGPYTYNGARYDEIATSQGLTALGIDEVPPIVTRGVLLDIARLKGRDILDDTYAVSGDDLEAAARAQGISVEPSDALLIHTGWGDLWMKDNERYRATNPGLGISGATWATDRRVCAIGADNWALEVVPGEERDILFPVHQHCIALYGCYLMENVVTAELARDEIHEFCFVCLPVRLRGASASPVAPVALV